MTYTLALPRSLCGTRWQPGRAPGAAGVSLWAPPLAPVQPAFPLLATVMLELHGQEQQASFKVLDLSLSRFAAVCTCHRNASQPSVPTAAPACSPAIIAGKLPSRLSSCTRLTAASVLKERSRLPARLQLLHWPHDSLDMRAVLCRQGVRIRTQPCHIMAHDRPRAPWCRLVLAWASAEQVPGLPAGHWEHWLCSAICAHLDVFSGQVSAALSLTQLVTMWINFKVPFCAHVCCLACSICACPYPTLSSQQGAAWLGHQSPHPCISAVVSGNYQGMTDTHTQGAHPGGLLLFLLAYCELTAGQG